MIRSRTRTMKTLVFLGGAVVLCLVLLSTACGDDDEDSAGGGETPTLSAGPTTSEGAVGETAQTAFEIKMIPTLKFDMTELSIPADESVTITTENTDDGELHNFAIYASRDSAETGDDPLIATEICAAPCSEEASVNLTSGEYFFRCDVHPNDMTGTLTVEGEG